MLNKIQFVASYTATTEATIHDIWAIWMDVNNWHTWDNGISKAEILGNFKVGNSFSLTPQGGKPVLVKLKTVTEGEEFSDEALLPFGVIRNYHKIEPNGKKVVLTHKIEAEINEDSSGFFQTEIWPHMQDGLPDSVKNIIALVQE